MAGNREVSGGVVPGGAGGSSQSSPEGSHVNVRGVLLFGAVLAALGIVAHVLVWWMFDYFARPAAADRPDFVIRARSDRLPPEPRLQGAPGHESHPLKELQDLRESETSVLGTFGWADRTGEKARVPIQDAMKMLLQRGVPVRGATKEEETSEELPRDSASGRPFRKSP